MAAPVATARLTPGGKMLLEGYKALVTQANDTDIEFYEKSSTPPSLDNGDEIDFTTQHNVQFRTKAPRGYYESTPLIDVGPLTVTAGYDPITYNSAKTALGKPTTITYEWGDGSTLAFYGYLKSHEPNETSEGEDPTTTVTYVCTNWDPTNKVEAGFTYTGVVGT